MKYGILSTEIFTYRYTFFDEQKDISIFINYLLTPLHGLSTSLLHVHIIAT